jgi:hypothetical protein
MKVALLRKQRAAKRWRQAHPIRYRLWWVLPKLAVGIVVLTVAFAFFRLPGPNVRHFWNKGFSPDFEVQTANWTEPFASLNGLVGPFNRLAVITSIVARSDRFDDSDLRLACADRTLEQCDLESKAITDAGLLELQSCPRLWAIHVECPKVSDAGLAAALSHLESLQVIEVISDQCRGDFLQDLKCQANLREITLRGRKIDDKTLAMLKEFPALQRIDLRGTSITDEGILELRGLPKLKYVEVSFTKITDEGIAAFDKAKNSSGDNEQEQVDDQKDE